MSTQLEHANYTVSDPQATAQWMCAVFDWRIRWTGPSLGNGTSIHVGTDSHYLALYTPDAETRPAPESYTTRGGLNHIAVVTDDLAALEARVRDAGFTPHSHADYEPGHRFYFHDHDGIEYEAVQYD